MLRALLDRFRKRPKDSYQYRVRRCIGGWEPQMSYTAGLVKGVIWYPLNEQGYWLEPDAFTQGNPTKRSPMTKSEADRAILRARAINGQHIR